MKSKKIRQLILEMIYTAQSGHPGGSLSLVEILLSLFDSQEGIFRKNKDRFILSKGHGVPAVYAIMHTELNILSLSELMTLRKLNSPLQGHPDRVKMPFLETSTGSLGQGASVAQGLAMALPDSFVYCIVGDGELQEGQIWEMALSSGFRKLHNLKVIIDYNKIQLDGFIKDILDLEPLDKKWLAFNWDVDIVDGHNISQVRSTLLKKTDKPHVLICNTVKGKGVSFMENSVEWHGKAPSLDLLNQAKKELL